MYKCSQELVSMVADTVREIASPALPGRDHVVLIYGIRSVSICVYAIYVSKGKKLRFVKILQSSSYNCRTLFR